MRTGRPPSWNPFSELDPGAWTEVVALSSKDRVTLPAAVRGRLPWFEAAAAEGLLAMLEPQGRAELTGWSANGPRALDDVAQRIEAADQALRGELAVAAMDRYMRLAIERPGRVAVNPNLAAHLDPDGGGVVRVVVRSARLWLWSEAQWRARRMDCIALLAPDYG